MDGYGRKDGENEPMMDTYKFARAHVDGRVSGVDTHMKEVSAFIHASNAESQSMSKVIRNHVWVDPAFAKPASQYLREHIVHATNALARLEETKKGFQKLPIERDLDLNAIADQRKTSSKDEQG
jgi:hypothetical protein